jgi:hypothetical protein
MGGEFFNAYIYYKIGWSVLTDHARGSLPSARSCTPLEPVVVINIDNTKVQIIIDIYKPHINYFVIIFVFILYEKVYSN